MSDRTHQTQSVELLQQLGLKEYEARCFVALCRLPNGTAKQISEISEVPRTRIYDAIRVLEAKGLVEVQHSSPKQFRAVSVEEAARTLREDFASRTESLREKLGGLESASVDEESDTTHKVWSLSGETAIETRSVELIEDADKEIVLVIGNGEAFTQELADTLRTRREAGVDVVVGSLNETIRQRIEEELPGVKTFVSGLAWLDNTTDESEDDVTISRLLLVDRRTILVSTLHTSQTGGVETAIFGTGFTNGLVVVARRLMATGLGSTADPGITD